MIMISFDIKDLCVNIPIDETLNIVKSKFNPITELFHVPTKNLSTCTGYFYGVTDI